MSFNLKSQFAIIVIFACIAILFPKIFYPMLMNQQNPTPKEYRNVGPKQERPPHLRPEMIHPAMRERGRTIPPHPTVPIIERAGKPEIRPGSPMTPGVPGPGMRMAAMGAQHQSKQASGINSVVMPIYTLGIVAFFIYTLVKIFLKNSNKTKQPIKEPDPVFANKVFADSKIDKKNPNPKLVYNCIQSIIEQTEKELDAKQGVAKIKDDTTDQNEDLLPSVENPENESVEEKETKEVCNGDANTDDQVKEEDAEPKETKEAENTDHDQEMEIRLKNLMESCSIKAVTNDDNSENTKSIYLDGELPHDSKILVSASETTTEIAPHENSDGTDEDIILSGKMTISLISLTNDDVKEKVAVVESPIIKAESANVTCA
jgi:hypothetical protein